MVSVREPFAMYAHVATPYLSKSQVGVMHDAMLLNEGVKEPPPFHVFSLAIQHSIVLNIELDSVRAHFPGSIGCSRGSWDCH
jgi:hypothetical protein